MDYGPNQPSRQANPGFGWLLLFVGLFCRVLAVGMAANAGPSLKSAMESAFQGGGDSSYTWRLASLNALAEFGLACAVLGVALVIIAAVRRSFR